MNENDDFLNLKLNFAIVFNGYVQDLSKTLSELEARGCKVIFVKKSFKKLFIEEEKDGTSQTG